MTGGSPTSGADPPPIRCSIRSVIRTFWRARARLHAPDADDASGGRRCLAARYGEKRGGRFAPPRFSPYAAPSLRSLSPCGPPLSPSSRFRCRSLPPCPVVGACTAAAGGRTAAVGGALPQWGALRAVAVALPAPRAAPPPSPPRRPARTPSQSPPHAGACARRPRRRESRATRPGYRDGAVPSVPGRPARSWGCVRGGDDGDARRPIGVGRRESASVGVGRRNAVMSNAVDAAAPARCAGGAVASRRVGGVLTGVPAPPAAASASAAARAAPRTRGTGGSREGRGSARLGRLARSRGRDSGATRPGIGMARFRRSWGVWRRPGGACGG